MHWAIEQLVREGSKERAVQREGRIRLHFLFIDLITILLLIVSPARFSVGDI